MRWSRVDAFIDGRDRARRHAGAAIDALIRMDVQHRRLRELGLVLARVDAVHRADVDAGGVLRFNARVGDDERHARESPFFSLDFRCCRSRFEPTDYTLRQTQKTSSGSTAADTPSTRTMAARPGSH